MESAWLIPFAVFYLPHGGRTLDKLFIGKEIESGLPLGFYRLLLAPDWAVKDAVNARLVNMDGGDRWKERAKRQQRGCERVFHRNRSGGE